MNTDCDHNQNWCTCTATNTHRKGTSSDKILANFVYETMKKRSGETMLKWWKWDTRCNQMDLPIVCFCVGAKQFGTAVSKTYLFSLTFHFRSHFHLIPIIIVFMKCFMSWRKKKQFSKLQHSRLFQANRHWFKGDKQSTVFV